MPNRFPIEGRAPEYNTVDATLWYFEAIRAYHEATHDEALLRDLFPVLQEIVDWHVRGTRYRIHLDPADGLLYAGEPGVQLTWVDAKADDAVVTPSIGKAVEVNALWYDALRVMADFARLLEDDGRRSPDRAHFASVRDLRRSRKTYEALAEQVRAGFARFWNAEAGYCYYVLDGPSGTTLRCVPTRSSPCLCRIERSPSSCRRPRWTPVPGICSPRTASAAWTRAIPTTRAATAGTGAGATWPITRARGGAGRSARSWAPIVY